MELKACSRCKVYRLSSEYCGSKFSKDGLYWICNRCINESYMRRQKKVKCKCGKEVNESYLSTHIHKNLHMRYLKNIFNYECMQPIAGN